MLYLLVWRLQDLRRPKSGSDFRTIADYREEDTFSDVERKTFEVVAREDLSTDDMRAYLGLGADNLDGPLIKVHEDEAPPKGFAEQMDEKGYVTFQPIPFSAADMDARK